jgi:hypothetical protein
MAIQEAIGQSATGIIEAHQFIWSTKQVVDHVQVNQGIAVK